MKTVLDDDLSYLIYSVVEEIPIGAVATYGQIAKLIGKEKNAKLVARALKLSSLYGNFPCHRVVNHEGRIAPGWSEQINLLKSEGITCKDEFHVDLKKHQWNTL